jgi:hypothetical protein
MSTTDNIGLKIPSIDDIGEQSFIDMEENLRIIDQTFPEFRDSLPTSGIYNRDKLVFLKNKSEGEDFLFINIRTGRACPTWVADTAYQVGDLIVPIINNGHYYECVQAGYSAPLSPVWLTSSESITEDLRNVTTWQPSQAYQVGNIVVPTINNDRFYKCVQAGYSGTGEPLWSTVNGTATADNQVVWLSYRITKWKESGVSVHFRPVAKIG